MYSILLPLFLLLQSIISSGQIFDLAPSDPPRPSKCVFEQDGLSYNLCPITQNRTLWWTSVEEQTPPTITKKTYIISLKGPLKNREDVPNEFQCPEGTWICMVVTNSSPNDKKSERRVLQVVPIAGNLELSGNHTREHHPGLNATFSVRRWNNTDPQLEIALNGGRYMGTEQSARIYLICDPDAEEPTQPSLWGAWGKKTVYHLFRWRTKHACASSVGESSRTRTRTRTSLPTRTTTPETPVDGNFPTENGDDEQEDFLLPESPFTPRRLTMTGVFIILLALATVGPLVYFWPKMRRSWYLRSKGYRFRVSERKLAHWAQEEINLGDEEDVMVNSNDDAVETNEALPLTPSPKKSNFNRGYGSAGSA